MNGFVAWLSLGRVELVLLLVGRFVLSLRVGVLLLVLLLLGGTKGRLAAFVLLELAAFVLAFALLEDAGRFSAVRFPPEGVARACFGEIDGA